MAQYIKIRDALEKLTAEREEADKPYRDGLQALEGIVNAEMLRQKVESFKTEHGTAYKTRLLSVKNANPALFHRFVLENNATQFLTAAVAKEAVKDYMDVNGGECPPGIETTIIHKVNFRRA